MGYSCWCSHLNLTIHLAKSPDHFPYSVTLGTKGLVISHLCTRAPFEAATSSTQGKSLYPTFVVYLRTIHGPLSFTVISELTLRSHHQLPDGIIYFFKERFGHFRIVLQIYDIYFYLSSYLSTFLRFGNFHRFTTL